MQSVFEFLFAHLRTPWNVAALSLRIELRAGPLRAALSLAAVLFSRAAPFARLGPLQVLSIFFLALVFRSTGLAQPDCYRLFRVPHLSPATGFEFPMFELVHDATDRFRLCLGLVSCHRLTDLAIFHLLNDRWSVSIGSRL